MPANPFATELERRDIGAESPLQIGTDYASRRFMNNLMATPRATGNLLAGGGALLEGVAAKATGGDFNIGERYRRGQESFPASLLRKIPAPTVEGIAARMESVPALFPGGESYSDALVRNRGEISARDEATRREHPVATTLGDIGGDIATLWAGRAPFATKIQAFEKALLPQNQIYFGSAQRAMEQSPGLARLANRVLQSPRLAKILRGLGRSAETGFEAAALEAIQGDDPLQSAGFAAGGQLGGSLLLHASKELLSGGPTQAGLKTVLAAGAIMGLYQTLKSATPGGRDRILESAESGFYKVALTLSLGAGAAMLGAGRGREYQLAEDLPVLVDMIATIPRGATLSLLTRLNDADDAERQTIENALTGLMSDPEYQGQNDAERSVIDQLRTNPFADELDRR